MPTYRYRCAKCGDELEEWQSFSDAPLTRHKACGGKLAKVLSTPGIVLKGSGFYRTDSRNGSNKKSAKRADEATTSGDQNEKNGQKAEGRTEKSDAASSSTSSSSSSGSSGDGGSASPAKSGDASSTS